MHNSINLIIDRCYSLNTSLSSARLMNVPELQRTMEEMRQEMMRAEIADEMMEEGLGASGIRRIKPKLGLSRP